jgi:hypothetical protein
MPLTPPPSFAPPRPSIPCPRGDYHHGKVAKTQVVSVESGDESATCRDSWKPGSGVKSCLRTEMAM